MGRSRSRSRSRSPTKRHKRKSEHKHKHKHEKKRRRDSSDSDSGSDSAERRRAKAERLARKLGEKLQKGDSVAGYTNETNPFGDANLTQRFVWHKKLEKQILEGVDPKELGLKAERQRQSEREVEIEKVKRRREEREQEKIAQEEEKERLERERAHFEGADLERKEELFHLRQARVRASIRLQEGRPRPVDLLAANLSYFAARAEVAAAPPGSLASVQRPRFNFRLQPESLAEGLSAHELAELEEDVRALAQLHSGEGVIEAEGASGPEQREFWECMTVICGADRETCLRREVEERTANRGGAGAASAPRPADEPGLHSSLDADVSSLFVGKSFGELLSLRGEVEASLRSGEAAEPEFWEAVLRRIGVALARARVREIHAGLRERALQVEEEETAGVAGAMGWGREPERPAEAEGRRGAAPEEGAGAAAAAAPRGPTHDVEASDGRFSPPRLSAAELSREEAGLEVVEAAAEWAELQAARRAVAARMQPQLAQAAAAAAAAAGPSVGDGGYRATVGQSREGGIPFGPFAEAVEADGGGALIAAAEAGQGAPLLSAAEVAAEEARSRELRAIAARAMGDDAEGAEVAFSGEVETESRVYWWHDKYRPRKPKYFNRVHTGYEWNKYNQTHYDHDNPPPKVVQGYKFNIFYPELIDKQKAPQFSISLDDSPGGETCILRFTAGPPYEDLAFRIVNKEWEHGHKRGFKSTFERGILHLHFNFVRPRYRR